MVFRLGLTYTKILINLDMKYVDASTKTHTLKSSIYESRDINMMLKSLHPDEVKVKITFDDNRSNRF